ncbi:MAG TPA: hypothetical protein VF549_18860 [Solirubrobacteraceae bacterium]|jgi:hypothetical protein
MAIPPDDGRDARIAALAERVEDPDLAATALPDEVRKAHLSAQESVVDARRNAELREGQLRIH